MWLQLGKCIEKFMVVACNSEVFLAQFLAMWEKEIQARVIGIQKLNWGDHSFFRDDLSKNNSP